MAGRRREDDRNAGTKWRRIKDNWAELERLGTNPDLGTVIGRLFMFKVLTEVEASAARLYAEVYGRYARHNSLARETCASPAYDRGFGKDDEIERHMRDGTMRTYERRANRAKKHWHKIQIAVAAAGCPLPVLHRLCVLNEEIPQSSHPLVKKALRDVASKFQIVGAVSHAAPEKQKRKTVERVALALDAAEREFASMRARPMGFYLLPASVKEAGICVTGVTNAEQQPVHSKVLIPVGKALVEELQALFVKLAESRHWIERPSLQQ